MTESRYSSLLHVRSSHVTGPYLRKLVREKVRENVVVLEYVSATKNAKVMRGNARRRPMQSYSVFRNNYVLFLEFSIYCRLSLASSSGLLWVIQKRMLKIHIIFPEHAVTLFVCRVVLHNKVRLLRKLKF